MSDADDLRTGKSDSESDGVVLYLLCQGTCQGTFLYKREASLVRQSSCKATLDQ